MLYFHQERGGGGRTPGTPYAGSATDQPLSLSKQSLNLEWFCAGILILFHQMRDVNPTLV